MIKDRYGYRGTQKLLAQWKQNQQNFLATSPEPGSEKEWIDQKQSIETEIFFIEKELQEFKDLVEGNTELPPLDSVEDFGNLLIKWRLAMGWSHEELAKKSDVDYILLAGYERYNYEPAPFKDILRIVGALKYGKPDNPINELEEALKESAD